MVGDSSLAELAIGPQDTAVTAFVRESNKIEGIERDPTMEEVFATTAFIAESTLSVEKICALQEVYAPGKPIRDRAGMNVRVGNYTAPSGGRTILVELMSLVGKLNKYGVGGPFRNTWKRHLEFERLHPLMYGNGRTGRAIWAWHMMRIGVDPFALPFLHRFYYQTLENDEMRS